MDNQLFKLLVFARIVFPCSKLKTTELLSKYYNFEGHIILPVIERFKKKYKIDKMVIIADSGLMSMQNVEKLKSKGYEFILGARIKNETDEIKEKILSLTIADGQNAVLKKGDLSLVINYSNKRAKKDKFNRNRGLMRLEKQISSGKLTKVNINNRGYNKYLKLDGEIKISIEKEKFEQDGKWDGLKGYITNTDLPEKDILKTKWFSELELHVIDHSLTFVL